MKTVVTFLLIVSLTVPCLAQNNDPPPPDDNPGGNMLALACVVVVVGAVVIYGLWKMCQKIPSPGAPPPQHTNAPPTIPPHGTNQPPVKTNPPPRRALSSVPLLPSELDSIPAYTISALGYPDEVQGGTYIYTWAFSVQSSTNLLDWQRTVDVRVFESSSGGQLWAAYQDGTNLYNAYFTNRSATNNLPVDFGLPDEDRQFFRLMSTNE